MDTDIIIEDYNLERYKKWQWSMGT